MDHEKRLADAYWDYFRVYPEVDDDPERLRVVYALRYRVYCIENPFEDPADFPDGLERDAFDAQSIHSLLVHRDTGKPAGTVRMVLPWGGSGDGEIPLDSVCAESVLRDESRFPRNRLAEISRFAIAKSFRQRRKLTWSTDPRDGVAADGRTIPADHHRVIPHMCLGLIEALVGNSGRRGITHWCAAMDPSLLRLLRQLSIHFHPLGPMVDYHGRRQPCYAELEPMLQRTRRERPDVWELITRDGRNWPGPFWGVAM